MDLINVGQLAKKASFQLATLSTRQKNIALSIIADELEINIETILMANTQDIELAKKTGLNDALIDRLKLTDKRIKDIANDVRNIVKLNDPIGSEIDKRILENGLSLSRRRVPLGVVGVIYEARPNVTIDIAALCIKTGNACILRGGKETFFSNMALVVIIQNALKQAKLPVDSIQYIPKSDREIVYQLLKMDEFIDIIIPRGGINLHKMCKENSTIPVIIGGFGVSHIFVDETADLHKSIDIIENAKMQRPSACNALDTLLIHQTISVDLLSLLASSLADKVLFVAEDYAMSLLKGTNVRSAIDQDFDTEWLGYILSVKVVKDIDEALTHMRDHNASHSDAIMTNNLFNAEKFISSVNSAAVYVNASTRFTDGAQFGLGAEVAVSTQKLHARGPMGLEELTSYQWVGKANYLSRE